MRACCANVLRICSAEHALHASIFETAETAETAAARRPFEAAGPTAGMGAAASAERASPEHADAAERPSAASAASVAAAMVELANTQLTSLCYPLYDLLRPLVLKQKSIDTLCEGVHP